MGLGVPTKLIGMRFCSMLEREGGAGVVMAVVCVVCVRATYGRGMKGLCASRT